MEPKIKALFKEDILEVAKTLYPMDPNSLNLLGGFESFVYEYTYEHKPYILKITHSSHRTKDQIDSEFDFVDYLSKHGGAVSKVILNRYGNYTHRYPLEEGYFTLSATEKAIGETPKDLLTNTLLQENYGQTIGKFHAITKNYKRTYSIEPRFTWFDDPLILEVDKYLDEQDAYVKHELDQVIRDISSIQQSSDNYGLIHTDIHRSNFLVNQDQTLTVFDFDDASYHYFLSDIAIAIFYSLFFNPEKEKLAKDFITHLMKGYFKEHTLTKADFTHIELFFRLRMIILYVALKRSTEPTHPFTVKFNSLYIDSIQHHEPFLMIDYHALYDEIMQSKS